MKRVHPSANQQIWYDENLFSGDPLQAFDPSYWQQQQKVTGSAQGRGTTWFVELANIEGALRHYRRGGLFGKVVKDQYWFHSWEQTRSYQEFILLQKLSQANVNVPRPIAARAVKNGPFYRADLLSEKVPNAKDLVDLLCSQPLNREIYQKIGQMVRRMHNAGVNHTDLNIHNILLDENEKVWIIDFDKCGFASLGGEWAEQNLARLKRSFLKEQPKFPTHWSLECWQWLLEGYQQSKENS